MKLKNSRNNEQSTVLSVRLTMRYSICDMGHVALPFWFKISAVIFPSHEGKNQLDGDDLSCAKNILN